MNILRMYLRSHPEHTYTALGARHNERRIDCLHDIPHIIGIYGNRLRQLLGCTGKLAHTRTPSPSIRLATNSFATSSSITQRVTASHPRAIKRHHALGREALVQMDNRCPVRSAKLAIDATD